MTPLVRLFLACLLINGAYDAIRVAVSYRVLALGGDAVTVGMVVATFALLPALTALRFGRLADRQHSWWILVAGIALTAAATFLAAFSPTIALLAVANTLLGLAQVMTMVAAQAFVMELSERRKHVNGFAMFTLAVSAGQTLGTPLMGWLLASGTTSGPVPTTMPLVVMATVSILALPCAMSLPRRESSPEDTTRPTETSLLSLLACRGMKPAMFAAFIVISGVDLITAFMPVIGEHVGIGPLVVSLLITTRSAFSMIARAAMPLLLRHFSQAALLIATPIVTTPPVLVLAFSDNVAILAVALAVIGLFWGINQPVTMNWVTAVAPPAERSAALSLRLSGNRVAQVAIPLGASAVAGITGPGSVFILTAALVALSGWSTSSSLRRDPPPELRPTPHFPARTSDQQKRTS